MKLKLVVASMSILGLVSCPVFAATTSKNKQRHHKKVMMKHHRMVKRSDYKSMGVLPVAAPVEACALTEEAILLTEMTQNVGRSLTNPCAPGWFNRVGVSGGINVDIGKWGNRNANYMGENYQRLSLNDAYINIFAVINDWAHAFASISYNTATINDVSSNVSEYSSAYSNNVVSGATNTLQLEQAYATIGNFNMSPIFLQVGKQFQDFSRYEIHPITRSMTQVMSETLATSIKLGFIADGFNGSVYVFDDPIPEFFHSSTTTNYGVALGYDQQGCDFGWSVGAAYLYNLIGVNDVAYNIEQFNRVTGTAFEDFAGYHSRVGGVALYADVNSGPFYIGARYTQATDNFNPLDLPENGVADLVGATYGNPVLATASGAKPWSAGIQANLAFDAWLCMNQNFYIGYQTSREAAGLYLPKHRYLAGYNVDVWKNTNFGIEWDQDRSYSTSDGGNGNNTTLVSLRAAVKFG